METENDQNVPTASDKEPKPREVREISLSTEGDLENQDDSMESGTDEEFVPKYRLRVLRCGIVMGPDLGVFNCIIILHLFFLGLSAGLGFSFADDKLFPMIMGFAFTDFLSLLSFLITSMTEPGAIKPQNKRHLRNLKRTLTEEEKKGLRPCEDCNLMVDYRTRHCPWCNVCVKELDHHCGVTGICIGARNKGHFIMLNIFSQIAWWNLIFLATFFGLHFIPSLEDNDTFFLVSYCVTGVILLIQVISIWFWIGMTFGWLDKKVLCGCIPNLTYFIHLCCWQRPTESRPTTWFISVVPRKSFFKCCCHNSCTVLEREFP